MPVKENEEIEKLRNDCRVLEEQVKLLVRTEIRLRRTQAELEKVKKEIEEYSMELEKKVDARTMELKKLNAELTDFTYIASHDLQEPLRKISAFSDRLKKNYYSALEDQGRDFLERIQKASIRMQKLINDLLSYSRVTTKPNPFVIVDLTQIVRDVLTDLDVRIEKTSGSVEMSQLPSIEADPTQMRQLFQNLIGNALKFHKLKVPPVVKIYRQEGPSDFFCSIVVEDNGIGIDAQYYDKIFEVFQRLHVNREYEGSGIGLAVCKKIVQRHSGSIRVESKPGSGTKFIVLLPLRQNSSLKGS